MIKVERLTPDDVLALKRAVLLGVGISEQLLKYRAAEGSLVGGEWGVWNDVEGIDYLLGGD
jgi:hypothetical protein